MKPIIAARQRKNWLSLWGVNCRQAEWNQFLPWGKEKIDYCREVWIVIRQNETDSCREAKKKSIIAVRRESPSGGMKFDSCREAKKISIIAVRRRKIDYCCEAKKKWYRREAWIAVKWNEIDSCREAKKKLIIAVRRELPSGGMKSILAVRQRKNQLSPWGVNCRQAERNRFLPWGKEKIDIAVRRRKNWLSPWGKEKIDYRREAKKNWLSPWGEEKIDYRREAKKNSIIVVRQRKNQLSPWGKEKINYRCEAKKKSILRQRKIRCCWEFISNTGAPLKRRAKVETVSLRAIISQNFSKLWETEGVVKRSLSDIIKGTDRPIPPSTRDLVP